MPVIEARYEGACSACGGNIVIGERVEYTTVGGPRHLACLDKPATLRRNQYRMKCSRCGRMLKKGEGDLRVNEVPENGEFTRYYEAICVDTVKCDDSVAGRTTLLYNARVRR